MNTQIGLSIVLLYNMHTRCQIFHACRYFKVSGDYFCLSSNFCKALLLLKPLGKFCFVEKVQAKIYALFKAWMILVFPLASFSLKLGVLEYENLQFLMATFRKMRGHFLHENTDVFLPPHYSFRHYGYHIFCRLFPQRYSRKKDVCSKYTKVVEVILQRPFSRPLGMGSFWNSWVIARGLIRK